MGKAGEGGYFPPLTKSVRLMVVLGMFASNGVITCIINRISPVENHSYIPAKHPKN